MITYVDMSLFDTCADCLVNTVNCEGFMSKGIAYQFKQRYPGNNEAYKIACDRGTMRIGTVLCYKENGVTIINFPTKDRWRRPSTMAYVEKGLDAMIRELPRLNVHTVAIPPLGCGNGGLAWTEVRGLIEKKLQSLDQFHFIICQPGNGIVHTALENQNPTAKSLVLLRIQERLKRFDMTRVLCSCAFVNYYCKRYVFTFSRWDKGPESSSIKEEAKRLKTYKAAHNFTSQEAYQAIYIRVCSKRTDSIIKNTEKAVEKAVSFVNRIDDDSVLIAAAALLQILSKGTKESPVAYSPEHRSALIDMIGDITEDNEHKAIDYLAAAGIIKMDLCGDLHLA